MDEDDALISRGGMKTGQARHAQRDRRLSLVVGKSRGGPD